MFQNYDVFDGGIYIYIYIYIYRYINECGGRVYLWHKVLNAVVIELSIHTLKN